MWTSNLLKQNAKNNMKPYYWTAFGVIVIMSIISYVISYLATLIPTAMLEVTVGVRDLDSILEDPTNPSTWIYYIINIGLSFLIAVFLTGILEIGKCRYFYKARNGDSDFGNLFWAFQSGRYTPCVKVLVQRWIEIFLYSLLLIIPGYIKALEYTLVPYLLAENPTLDKKRAFEISRQTMKGEKMKFFLLAFSFIGWFILGLFACYIGIFFAISYYQATETEFYACMRAKMLALGITTEEELSGYDRFNGGYPGNTAYNPYQKQNPYNQQNPYQNPNPYEPQSPYQNPNPYEPQSPYQNPNPYEPQNPYQNPNPYEPQNPYQNPNPYELQNPYQNPNQPDNNSASHRVNLDKNPYDDNQNNQF